MSDLGYVGFAKLRPGCIHLFCPGCGRKMSNVPRTREYDPEAAVLAHVYCARCSNGNKDSGIEYLDAEGRFLNWETGKPWPAPKKARKS